MRENEYMTINTEPMRLSVSDIAVRQRNGWTAKLNMQPDITPIEVGLIMFFIFSVGYQGYGEYDIAGYISEHKLERHFEITEGERL